MVPIYVSLLVKASTYFLCNIKEGGEIYREEEGGNEFIHVYVNILGGDVKGRREKEERRVKALKANWTALTLKEKPSSFTAGTTSHFQISSLSPNFCSQI